VNSLERVEAAVRFNDSDYPPVIAQVFGHAAIFAGVPLGRYVRSGELIARCQAEALEHYGYDAVFALMDVSVETEAVGSKVEYPENGYPYVKSYILSGGTRLDNLELPDPYSAGRMPELLKAVTLLSEEVGGSTLVVGCVLGPMTLTTQLLGMEDALYLAVDNPEEFSRVLEFSTAVIIKFGLAQIEAGAHLPLVFDPSASPAVVPPQFFREFELPLLKEAFASFKSAGAKANWLHIAGPSDNILPLYPEAGVDIANFDYFVDPSVARHALPGTCLDGNIKPVSFIEGPPESISNEASGLLATFSDRGGFILSPGCEIPPESKPANIEAMIAAARNNG